MVVERSAAVRTGENVCVVTDTNKVTIARALAAACYAVGAETVICVMTPRQMHGNEPPPVVAAAMKAAQVILAPTTYAITHTDARIAASEAGARVIILRSITADSFVHGAVTADYEEVHALTQAVAARLTSASSIRLTCPLGSDLSLSIEGRSALTLGGIARQPGQFTPLPTGEAAIVPLEGTAEGVLVVGYAIDGVGVLRQPVQLIVERGRVVKIEGGVEADRLRKIVEEADENATNIAEFAIGTNPLSRMLGNMAEDKVKKGCVHVAIGDNHSIGGVVSSAIHLDHVILNPTVWLDEVETVREGKLNLG